MERLSDQTRNKKETRNATVKLWSIEAGSLSACLMTTYAKWGICAQLLEWLQEVHEIFVVTSCALRAYYDPISSSATPNEATLHARIRHQSLKSESDFSEAHMKIRVCAFYANPCQVQ